jgi:5-carboxymethyl-2-hydroxymuconate isomerase
MPGLSLGEWFFLALGVGGFVRFGWCLVFLIGDEAPVRAWLDEALDILAGRALAAIASARQQARTAAALLALLTVTPGDAR